jgi:hypothetical protein
MRSAAIALLLKDFVMCARLRPLPLHPDKAGGLRPVGQLGLRNQYMLSVFGVNVVLLVVVSVINLDVPSSAAVIAYLILGPIVFLGPLLPFRGGLRRTKSELMGEVAQRLRRELVRIRTLLLTSGPISREDEELIDRLRKIAAVIDELPVWPFDARILRRFLAAYVTPMMSAIGYPILKWLVVSLFHHFRP